jgi:hypothetical protein
VRRRWAIGSLVAVVVTLVGTSATGASTGGAARRGMGSQAATPAYLNLDSVSPWVDAEGTWSVEWAVASEPPADASVRYTIHQALSGADARARLDQAIDDDVLGPNLQSAVQVPLAQMRSGTTARLDVAVRSKSGTSDRVLLPNAGVHPVEIDLVAGDGTELQHMVLFLNRLPVEDVAPAMRVAPLASLVSGPVIGSDGAVAIPGETRVAADSLTELLDDSPRSPLTVHLDPEVVAGSYQSTDPDDATRMDALIAAVGERPVMRTSWVPIDLESWATSGSLTTFQTSVLAGQRTLADAFDQRPDGSVWPVDPMVGPESPGWLDAVGVRRMLLRPDQVAPTRDLGDDAGTTQRFLVGDADSDIDGLVLDPTVASRLTGTDPTLAAHEAVTELQAMWFIAPKGATTASVVDLTDVAVPVASAFLDVLASDNPTLEPSSVGEAFEKSTAYPESPRRRSGTLVRRIVREAPVTDVSAISRELSRLRGRAAAYHSSIADPEGVAPLDEMLLTVQHRDLAVADQLMHLAAIGRRIDEGLSFIVQPESRSFTVTARRSELPLTITNNGDREVTVLLRFNGNRLEANNGRPRRVTLQPGPNSITVPVLARTSGDFNMAVEVRTADDSILLASTGVRIRSTVVSGVGVAIAIGALLFLVLWWGATIRRNRRRRDEPDEPEHDPAPTDAPAASVA